MITIGYHVIFALKLVETVENMIFGISDIFAYAKVQLVMQILFGCSDHFNMAAISKMADKSYLER